jgi:hypothetical protein
VRIANNGSLITRHKLDGYPHIAYAAFDACHGRSRFRATRPHEEVACSKWVIFDAAMQAPAHNGFGTEKGTRKSQSRISFTQLLLALIWS